MVKSIGHKTVKPLRVSEEKKQMLLQIMDTYKMSIMRASIAVDIPLHIAKAIVD